MLDFPGVGRIIERSADDLIESVAQEVKQLDTTAGLQLDPESTGLNLSGRCLSDDARLSPGRVSPDEAQLICKSVLSELLAHADGSQAAPASLTPRESTLSTPRDAAPLTPKDQSHMDLACVQVLACDRGCISGMLEWLGRTCENRYQAKVAFTLLEIRPGYTVVGEAMEGPKLLSSLCWKLQSINGSADSRPAWIRKGDVLILEGPRWATKRLMQPLPPVRTPSGSLPASPEKEAPIGLLPPSSARSASAAAEAAMPQDPPQPRLMSASTPPQIAKPSRTTRMPEQATGVNQLVRPVIPVLDLASVVERREASALQKISQCQALRGNGEEFNGCDFGFLDCKMVPPGKTLQDKKPKDPFWHGWF